MPAEQSHKVVRSYRLVFRRRWRIFRLQNWRIPLPNGLELRVIGYWLVCLAAFLLLGRVPLLGEVLISLPESLRLVALPVAGAWFLAQWEIDGRSPHRALIGILGYWLRPRALAGFRRCPVEGQVLVPLERVSQAPDVSGSRYPRGCLVGPAKVLLRYPVRIELRQVPSRTGAASSERMAAARQWHITGARRVPFHKGKVLDVPVGRKVIFE